MPVVTFASFIVIPNTPEKTLHEIKAVVIAGKNIPFLNAPYNYMLEQVRYVDSAVRGMVQDGLQ